MGHDIYAYLPCEEKPEEPTIVAYNRRSARDPLNQVLYLALGVFDEAYGGASGKGKDFDMGIRQFRDAVRVIEAKNYEFMDRDENAVDTLSQLLADAGVEQVDLPTTDGDPAQERDFCLECIEFLEARELDSLKVIFG